MFQYMEEQIKNQELSDSMIDSINNHIDSTQKDSVVDRIMDYIKYTKITNHKYQTHD